VIHRFRGRLIGSSIILAALIFAACNMPAPGASPIATLTPFSPSNPTAQGDSRPWTGSFAEPAATFESSKPQAMGDGTISPSVSLSPQEQAAADNILQAINQLRMALGSRTLEADPILTGLAGMRAQDMAGRNYLDHSDPVDGRLLGRSAMLQAGYRGKLAEDLFAADIALDQVPSAVIDAWLKSSLHRQVAVDAHFHYAGIALGYDGKWWRVVLLLAETR
jgi:uncharacterized protein YkwD